MNLEKTLDQILSGISEIDYVHTEDIPDIYLYMDQVTSFMDEQLKEGKRYEEDKILTKTMINNYTKNHLLPPPEKKKYSKEHMLILLFIYYFKNFLSIKDIQALLDPLTKNYFEKEDSLNMTAIYEEISHLEMTQIPSIEEDIKRRFADAEQSFKDVPENERDYLQLFTFICSLSFDVYIKKMIIEKLIDQLPGQEPGKKKKTTQKKE